MEKTTNSSITEFNTRNEVDKAYEQAFPASSFGIDVDKVRSYHLIESGIVNQPEFKNVGFRTDEETNYLAYRDTKAYIVNQIQQFKDIVKANTNPKLSQIFRKINNMNDDVVYE